MSRREGAGLWLLGRKGEARRLLVGEEGRERGGGWKEWRGSIRCPDVTSSTHYR